MNEVTRNIRVGFTPQAGPQEAFILCPLDIVVYGGARGGGKTFASLGEFFLHAEKHGEHARGLMIRKTREDLKDTIAVATSMYSGSARWIEKGAFFRFNSGARLYCAYLENEHDAEHYQGWSLTRVYVEEATQFLSSAPIFKLLATLRSAHGIKGQMRLTCNPGGPGHLWVKHWAIDHGAYRVVTDPETGLRRTFIPALLSDNPALMDSDPDYVNKLKAVGSPQLVQAWLYGDWNVIEGQFFSEWNPQRHVITPFTIPSDWLRFRAMDWGSSAPFSVGWYAVVQDDMLHDGRTLKREAIVRYREYYGMQPGKPNVGLKMPAEEVARNIVARETNGHREDIAYGVLDPAAFAVISGPSIGETFLKHGVVFRRADNTRVSRDKRMGGFDQIRARLKGDLDGNPMVFAFSTCQHLLRCLPVMQHDAAHPEDMDSEMEDHVVDEFRYAMMSRPYRARITKAEDMNPYRVSNAFRLGDLD